MNPILKKGAPVIAGFITGWLFGRSLLDLLRGPTFPAIAPSRARSLAALRDRIVALSRADIGNIVETSKNSSPAIDAMLKDLGQGPAQNWCAAYVHDVIRRANDENIDIGIVRSAGAKATGSSFKRIIQAKDATPDNVPPGSIPYWDRSDPAKPETSWWGHIGILDHWTGNTTFDTNEGNSGPTADRVARMHRTTTDPKFIGFGVWS